MAAILIHPKKDQLEAVKSFLKSLKVPFEEQESIDVLPDHVMRDLEISQKQTSEGKLTAFTGIDDMLRFRDI